MTAGRGAAECLALPRGTVSVPRTLSPEDERAIVTNARGADVWRREERPQSAWCRWVRKPLC